MTTLPFHLMLKPAGSACNLACEYCYYLGKRALYPHGACRMDDATLERTIAGYLGAHPGGEVTFGWQGGEPLLMGREFFTRALDLQAQYTRPGQQVINAIQTNGTLVDDDWAEFFAARSFLVGLSVDGPAALHDRYRRAPGGDPSQARVIAGLRRLQQHQVDYNLLVTVNRGNADHPREVYDYLVELGAEHLQFIPIVERERPGSRQVAPYSVRPGQYGAFLCGVFEEWVRRDVGRVFLQIVESTLNVWLGGPPTICVFSATCGRAMAVEHNGDVYACDHYVYPDYLRGNLCAEELPALVDSPTQRAFGLAKAELSGECRRCPVRPFCGGDCPKHRLRLAEDGKPISYLCPGLRQFFQHTAPVLQAMANEIRAGRPASNVMEVLQAMK